MNTSINRRLPSADWIAFGIAVVALSLQYVFPFVLVIVGLAVFTPSVLREIGVLKDADEWSTGIMHRAGFHALLAVSALFALNHIVITAGWFEPAWETARPLGIGFFRKAVIEVFLVSYVIQYWGVRRGIFRVLVVMGLVILVMLGSIKLGWTFRPQPNPMYVNLPFLSVYGLVLISTAVLSRRRPLIGAVLLTLILVYVSLPIINYAVNYQQRPQEDWESFTVILDQILVLGMATIVLWRKKAFRSASEAKRSWLDGPLAQLAAAGVIVGSIVMWAVLIGGGSEPADQTPHRYVRASWHTSDNSDNTTPVPGVDLAMVQWCIRDSNLTYLIWTDLDPAKGSSTGGGITRSAKHVRSDQHLMTFGDDKQIEHQFGLDLKDPDDVGVVTIAGVDYGLNEGALFLISTQGPQLRVQQIPLDPRLSGLLLDETQTPESIKAALMAIARENTNVRAFFE